MRDVPVSTPGCGEVDRLWWLSVGLGWRELAEGTVRPVGVVMQQVLGPRLAAVVLIDDQQPVKDLPAEGTELPPRGWRCGTGLGHADDRDAEHRMRVRVQAGAPAWDQDRRSHR